MSRWPDPPRLPVLVPAALAVTVSACVHGDGYTGTASGSVDKAWTHDSGGPPPEDSAVVTIGSYATYDTAPTGDTALTHDSGGYTGTATGPIDTGGSGSSGSGGSYAIAGSGAPVAPGLPPLAAPGGMSSVPHTSAEQVP